MDELLLRVGNGHKTLLLDRLVDKGRAAAAVRLKAEISRGFRRMDVMRTNRQKILRVTLLVLFGASGRR
jgi:hypothetical protein